MKLSEVIRERKGRIASDWIKFAMENIPAARTIGEDAARDHVLEMLESMAQDMDTAQTTQQQSEKSLGNKPANLKHDLAAKTHGDQRVGLGFTIADASAEFRALRASVLRVWEEEIEKPLGADEVDEIMRFNEAVDEAWMHSIHSFHAKVEQSRIWFLGVLGHDLRTPLTAIKSAGELLAEAEGLSDAERELVQDTQSSVRRMNQLISNLLELTRAQLGSGLKIRREGMDLEEVCLGVVRELRVAYPDVAINIDATGELIGQWDPLRLSQVVENLVSNALRHGRPGGPVGVRLSADADTCQIEIHNEGPPIPPRVRKLMFHGMVTDSGEGSHRPSSSVGLGLYIVSEIVAAHQGTVDVVSTEKAGTTFTVSLPRSTGQDPAQAE